MTTVLLTYGGGGGSMGKSGSFDCKKGWYGFTNLLSTDQESQAAFDSMVDTSNVMKAAVVQRFPVPKYKEDTSTEAVLELIRRLDSEMSPTEKAAKLDELLVPCADQPAFQDVSCYLLGPFISTTLLLDALQADPMLQPVYAKWKAFESTVLDAMFEGCTAVYLQIRWQGWYVRPVREFTLTEFDAALSAARTDADE